MRNLVEGQRSESRTSTWLELFFDLCFVVAVAALARGLHDDPTWSRALWFAGLFVPVWWSGMIFTWYATAFNNDDVQYRTTLPAAMLFVLWPPRWAARALRGDSGLYRALQAPQHQTLGGGFDRIAYEFLLSSTNPTAPPPGQPTQSSISGWSGGWLRVLPACRSRVPVTRTGAFLSGETYQDLYWRRK